MPQLLFVFGTRDVYYLEIKMTKDKVTRYLERFYKKYWSEPRKHDRKRLGGYVRL